MKKIILVLFIMLFIGFSFAQDFYPTAISGLKSEIRLYGFGTIEGLKSGEEITFQTITFPASGFQKSKVIKEALYINGKTIFSSYIVDEFENKYVQFKVPYNGDFNFEIIAEVETQSLIYEMNDYNLGEVSASVQSFLESSEKVESDSSQILTLTKNKLFSNSFLENLKDTIIWVNDYVKYADGPEFNKYYLLQKSAVETLIEKKGVCDEFSNLAAAMLRAKGIPTRLAIGITFDGIEWGNHAWLEVYHNTFGWIPSDPTFREPGFVDATHIRLGSFSDVSMSVARATYPSTATVTFQTQTLPEVKVIDKNYFSHVKIHSNTNELLTNRWNSFPVSVKNFTNATLTVPIKIRENYEALLIEEKTQSIVLAPGETREVVFNIYPKVSLKVNELAKGSFTFDSLNEPYKVDFTIKPSALIDNGEVKVVDVTPIAFEDKLKLEIKIINMKTESKKININLIGPDMNEFWDENWPAFSTTTFSKEIMNYENKEYKLIIDTPTQQYTQYIYPVKSTNQIVSEKPKKNTVVQKVDTGKPKATEGVSNVELFMFIGLAVLTAITLALIFLLGTRRRYI